MMETEKLTTVEDNKVEARRRGRRRKRPYSCETGPKRRYCCSRRRKATTKRCCRGGIRSKVTWCNRNWRRISVYPFVNFVRQFRKKMRTKSIAYIVKKARAVWCKMSQCKKRRFIIEACRARKRGYRT